MQPPSIPEMTNRDIVCICILRAVRMGYNQALFSSIWFRDPNFDNIADRHWNSQRLVEYCSRNSTQKVVKNKAWDNPFHHGPMEIALLFLPVHYFPMRGHCYCVTQIYPYWVTLSRENILWGVSRFIWPAARITKYALLPMQIFEFIRAIEYPVQAIYFVVIL